MAKRKNDSEDKEEKKDWYALGKEADAEDAKSTTSGKANKKSISGSRSEWYEAAGQEVPKDLPKAAPLKGKAKRAAPLEALDPNHQEDLLQVSAGRSDPPWNKIIAGICALVLVGVLGTLATRKPEKGPREIDLPIKNIQNNRMFGYIVDPPTGFRQQIIPEPDFLNGIHGEPPHAMTCFINTSAGISAYYFGEMRKDISLDKYVEIGTDVVGKVSLKPLDAIPEGMKDYPTKGFLIDAGDKVMLYYASQDKDIFVSVYAVASKAAFDKQSEDVQAAVRALKVTKPTGPHPDKQFTTLVPE